jgi:hypothetical protein
MKSRFEKYLRKTTLTLHDGGTVEAVELSGADDAAIREAMPPPQPPLVKDPNRGSAAPLVPNENDPAFRAAFDGWYGRRAVVRLAAATGWEPDGLGKWNPDAPVEARRAWCEKTHAEVLRAVGEAELVRLCGDYRDFLQASTEGVGLGHSGAGASPAPNPS